MRPGEVLALVLMASCATVGCGASVLEVLPPPGVQVASITVTSRSFASGATIPVDYTCDGKNVSPQITWSAPPEGTKSLALVVDDPEAGNKFVHWMVFDILPSATSLAEGADIGQLGAKLGVNGANDVRYTGPCPPHGEMHRYVFHLLALDKVLDLPEGSRRGALEVAMNGHLIGEGTLSGLAAR